MLWVIFLLESPPTAKSQPSGRGNKIFRQNCLMVELIIPSILTSAPEPLELKRPQNMTGQPPYFTVGMRCFSLYASPFLHADAVPGKKVQFWSHLTRAPCSNPNVNDVWQTPSAFFCVLWSEKAFFWQPFQ